MGSTRHQTRYEEAPAGKKEGKRGGDGRGMDGEENRGGERTWRDDCEILRLYTLVTLPSVTKI